MPRKKQIVAKRSTQHRGKWVVDVGRVRNSDGSVSRRRRFFPTRQAADEYADSVRRSIAEHGISAMALTGSESSRFAAARDKLAAAGATIEDAVEFFLDARRPIQRAVALGELLARCLEDKALAGCTARYLASFGCSCRSFVRGREGLPASSATRDMVRDWVLGNGWSPKTQRNYLGDVREMFAWGKREGLLTATPLAGEDGFVRLSPNADGEIVCLDVATCAALLRTALFGERATSLRAGTGKWSRQMVRGGFRELIPALVLGMFAGVRPEEIQRMGVDGVDLKERTAVVAGRQAKTRRRRVVEMDGASARWLRLWRRLCPDQSSFAPKNFARKWDALRAAAGVLDWPHDALRHTAASYHYASHKDEAALKAMLGHAASEDTLFRHYRAVRTCGGQTVTRKLAVEFWGLCPSRVRGSAGPRVERGR